eukprot:CAMPEP_0197233778 /NCGR_PEP_ID=MMETSP1429-20130617/1758_1 /TAXON_ID=49237 /ORGANISM="Chaetoceros  sp., Strain UNC1202" /LENGTH=147 /DNA_ID=CAMNT_0042692089 /DNA_START=98 /DNA_END=541 /DNA_ORIENTATION=-
MSKALQTSLTAAASEDGASAAPTPFTSNVPINVASISSGFEKGDFLVREAKGQRVYFDFFEEAFNYLANKGFARMKGEESEDWIDAISTSHNSIPNGTRYNTGQLLMVLSKPVDVNTIYQNNSEHPSSASLNNSKSTDENRDGNGLV